MKSTRIRKATSNPDFAQRIGVHFTMASRLRNGDRMPSTAVLSRIISEFGLEGRTLEEFMAAAGRGQQALGRWINANLFERPEE